MTNYPISRSANIVEQLVEDELLIFDLEINKAFCLNQTAKLVYQLCNGKNSVHDICELMSQNLQAPVSKDFVWLTLNELNKNSLLENNKNLKKNFDRIDRRELIKRIGISTMIPLPFISSIVAPTALMAQSVGGLPLLAYCMTNSECQSGKCANTGDVLGFQCCHSQSGPNPQQPFTYLGCHPDCSGLNSQCCSFNVAADPELTEIGCAPGTVACACV